jgi:26S proteasome regulatory subunit N7
MLCLYSFGDFLCPLLITICLTLQQVSKLAQDGGDWDRRNRLKVYTALSKLLARDVKEAASLLIDCLATFSCAELCSYPDFVVYTIISNILHLPRTELKEKIIDGSDILSVANKIPIVVCTVVSSFALTHSFAFANSSDRFLCSDWIGKCLV